MNKSERLAEMMIYLNNKDFFNLKNLMTRYQISKSTALRDIQSLEAIGMPIYAEHGRHGRYGILKNRLLSPIIFTIDELYSLYFAMLTLRAYQSTPFHLDLAKLKLKFESCLSGEHIAKLKKMEKIFSLASQKHPNSSPFLKDILEHALENKVSSVSYKKGHDVQKITLQFFAVTSSYGQWYATAYNHVSGQIQVLRCDKITKLDAACHTPISIEKLKSTTNNLFKKQNAVDFEVFVTSKGADLFFKEHYPSMSLDYKDGRACIKGFYNPGEEKFISNYFSSFGMEISAIYPAKLKELVLLKTRKIADYYETL
ncbi:MAG: helix-turn-helix transcriptional regulator [Lachnospiraceae bacterium]